MLAALLLITIAVVCEYVEMVPSPKPNDLLPMTLTTLIIIVKTTKTHNPGGKIPRITG